MGLKACLGLTSLTISQTSAVPEPSALMLLGTGLIDGIGAMRRKPARRDQHDLADLQQVLMFLVELESPVVRGREAPVSTDPNEISQPE